MKRIMILVVISVFFLVFGNVSAPAVQKGNPFFEPQRTPFRVPPFDRIKTGHFLPAIEEGIGREQTEIDRIAANPGAPTFENTIAALDSSGVFLSEVTAVFGALQGADTNPDLQAMAKQTAPLLAAHNDDISLNERLFRRVKTVYDRRHALNLNQDQLFLLENTYGDFVRSGALLDPGQKECLRELNKDLSLLSVQFGENLLAETNDFKLIIADHADLAGLPPAVVAMAGAAAKQAGLAGKWMFTIQIPSMIPFLQYSEKGTCAKSFTGPTSPAATGRTAVTTSRSSGGS